MLRCPTISYHFWDGADDDRDTQREITDRDTGTQMTTGTQGHNYNRDSGRAHGGYINDDGDTGNIRLAITINKAQGQSLEKCSIYLNTDCFSMDNYMLHVQESVNLTIYLYAQKMGQRRILYIRKLYVVKDIYPHSQVGHKDTTTMVRN